MTIEELKDVGFIEENWPENLPLPGESNITSEVLEGTRHLYKYSAVVDGDTYVGTVEVDHGLVDQPAEGVVFMLGQFGYLFRSKPDRVKVTEGTEPFKAAF